MNTHIKFHLLLFLLFSIKLLGEDPTFKSELFKSGKLIYSDDFDGELNLDFWGQPKGKKIEDGKLIIGPLFQSKEEAMKVNESETKVNENHKEPQVPLRYFHRGGEGKPIRQA